MDIRLFVCRNVDTTLKNKIQKYLHHCLNRQDHLYLSNTQVQNENV